MYNLLIALFNGIIRILFNYKVEGLENLPQDGAYILACNHRTMWDPIFIACAVKRRCSFIAKIEFFKNKLIAKLFTWLGAFPVDRGAADMAALDKAVNDIKSGKPFVIFPEGTRTKTGKLGRGKSGVAIIAGNTNADLVPVAICYDGKLRFRKKVTLKFGPIIPFEDFQITDNDRKQIRSAVKRIMNDIASLLGEDYNGWY